MFFMSDTMKPSYIKYLEFEYLTFDELMGILNESRTTTIHGNYVWGVLCRLVIDRKIKTDSVYKDYVFKGYYRNGVEVTDEAIDEYINSLVEITDTKTGTVDYDECHVVVKHKKSGRYMIMYGEYNSYMGVEYSGFWREVKPVEITTIEYQLIE